MIYARKIEIQFDDKDVIILDGQSKICNWRYNQLLQVTIEDYKNGNEKKLLSGRNLRDYSTKMKNNNPFLYSVHSSPIKNTAIRVKESYEKFFKKNCCYPNFRSFKKKWFSLFYDEPNKGFKLLDNDKLIDEVKSKRDLCNRKNKLKYSEHGNKYYLPSKRYLRLNETLHKLYYKRREQIKLIMYSIANYIARNYDKAVIGDYTPTLEVANDKNMHRGMLNQSLIGMFRKILSWTMEKYNKTCIVVNEKDTTKTCCICGDLEKKYPSIREFTCKNCNTTILRDVNSAINIARKDKLEPTKKVLNKILKKGYFRFDRYTLEGI